MSFSKRAQEISPSLTLALNTKAKTLRDSGKQIFNLTAGQLPFKPPVGFVKGMSKEAESLSSYQYSPVAGLAELREKVLNHYLSKRGAEDQKDKLSCLFGAGGKGILFESLSCLCDPEDEVILFSPYWTSYPEMISLVGAKTKILSPPEGSYVPKVSDLEAIVSDKTKVIILNSPNNPSGLHYDESWMKIFAEFLKLHPRIWVISDEIYDDLYYFDPGPTYFYESQSDLLERTVIVNGISKSLAATGLRLGYTIGPKNFIEKMNALQGHIASGPNTLTQSALLGFSFSESEEFLKEVKNHLRENVKTLRSVLTATGLDRVWYQPRSAFYFLVDFSKTPLGKDLGKEDLSLEICEKILSDIGVAIVPGAAFGVSNCARISLVLEQKAFKEAVEKLCHYLCEKIL